MRLNQRRVFVRGHLKHCVTNWFADHPPKVQLDIIHILLHEIEMVGSLNVKGLTIKVSV